MCLRDSLYGYVDNTNVWIDVFGYAGYKFTKKSKMHIHERHIKKSGYSHEKRNWINKSKFKNPKIVIKDAGKLIDNPDKVTPQGNRTLYQKNMPRQVGRNPEETVQRLSLIHI